MDITLLVATRRHLGCLDTTSGDLRAARRVLASLLAAAGFGALTFVHPSSGQAWTADAASTQEMVR